jgi:phage shock protein A
MSDIAPPTYEKKSFWKRPEGITGAIFLTAVLGGLGFLIASNMAFLAELAANTVYLVLMLMALAALIYVILDPKMRNLIWYMYKSVMRSVTGVFVQIDPVGILKSYVEDLQDNLGKMSTQIGNLKGQIRKMSTLMDENNKEIQNNLKLASVAKQQNNESQVVLATRKAARLQETNEKYAALHGKMEILYRILDKMYKNSEILLEDTRDQVKLKEQERKAIRASHSAMKSAMSVISGDPDKRAMFDAAIENIADDVANKVGEMERFMEMSANFMDSIDLQQGVFQEEGLKMLEEWEEKSTLMLLGPKTTSSDTLDLNRPSARPEAQGRSGGGESYDNLFK